MARIAGVDLPHKKRMEIALTYIYGIGHSAAHKICTEAGVDPARSSDELTDDEITRLRRVIDAGFKVEGDLRRDVAANIKRLEIGRAACRERGEMTVCADARTEGAKH